MAPITRQKARELRKREETKISRQHAEPVKTEPNIKVQALPDEIFWMSAKQFLHPPRDIFHLAISSRGLWNVLKIELYSVGVLLSKETETIEDIRKDIPLRTPLPPLDIEPLDFPPDIADELLHRNSPDDGRDPPWKEFFSRPRMSRRSPLHRAAVGGYTEMAGNVIQAAKTTWPDFIDAKDPNGDTAIHLAAQAGHLDIVRLLVDAGCFIASPSGYFYWTSEVIGDGTTSRAGRIELVEKPLTDIINRIVPKTMNTPKGFYCLAESSPRFAIDALGLAIINRHKETARYLFDYYDENFARDWHIMSPLHLAALAGQYKILEKMLAQGSDANLRCPHFHNATLAHMAAISNRDIAATIKLLQCHHRGSLDGWDDSSRSPLRWAMDHGLMDNASYLVKMRVTLDIHTMSVCMGSDDWWACTEEILDAVENSPEVLRQGETALQLCTQSLISGYRADSKYPKTMEHIIKKRVGLGPVDPRQYCDPDCAEFEGTSSLHVAASSKEFPEHLFKLLLDQKPVDINSRDLHGLTVMDHAWVDGEAWKVNLVRENGGVRACQLKKQKRGDQTKTGC